MVKSNIRRAGVPAALLAAGAVLLAGCGAPSGSASDAAPASAVRASSAPSGAAARFNGTDVMFAQMMVPHHGQGIEIVRLASGRATDAELKTLAAAIETTQSAEIQTMAGWLRAWGQPSTAAASEHAAHGGMPGTSRAEIATLRRATGADFDRKFLNMMIAHQDDAIQMARMEESSGINPEARALAGRIDRSRTAQIQQMLALIKRLAP